MAGQVYRIRNWDKHFENAASHKVVHCSWCPIPNRQDGLGYSLLLRGARGPARYGAWVAIVLMASKQDRPRNGWLTDDGTHSGRPLGAYEIGLQTKLPEKVIQDALEILSSLEIGWLEFISPSDHQHATSALSTHYQRGSNITEQKGTEGKGTEQKEAAAPGGPPFYLTYRKGKLTGFMLEGFSRFWLVWRGRDKSRAADTWLDLPWPGGNRATAANRALLEQIVAGARKAVDERPRVEARGGTYKYAHGWLAERRYEAYTLSAAEQAAAHKQARSQARQRQAKAHRLADDAASPGEVSGHLKDAIARVAATAGGSAATNFHGIGTMSGGTSAARRSPGKGPG